MKALVRALLAFVAVALLVRPASAESWLDRVERELEAHRALAPLVEELAARDRAQRAEFETAARRPLPGKARERLAATRSAWEQGQGRLLRLLRAVLADATRGGPGGSTSASADEVLSLVRQIRDASRPEPLSTGELKTRVPDLHAPALASGTATQVAAGDEPPIGAIPPEVRARAAALAGPIDVYEWVRNAIRPELYHGVLKGPLQTLLEGGGNDADTAGLLIALLRAKGVPTRYVRGTVEIAAPVAAAITGTATPERALRAFRRAGIPVEEVRGAGALAGLRVERVWAEANLPYANYRGAVLDAQEKTWVPLDPGYKRLAPPGGLDLRTIGFDPSAAFEDYLAQAPGGTPRELLRQRAQAALAQQRPGVPYEAALAHRDVIAQNLGLLPSTLPYAILTRAEVGYEPPAALVHEARFVLESNGVSLLDASFAAQELLGRRLTLGYVPLDADDEEVVRQYGGLFRTPPYLVEVKPVLRLAGVTIAIGSGGAGLGVTLDLRVELRAPGGADVVANRVVAGNLTAIGLAAGEVTAEESREDEAARVLARLAFHYLARWNDSDQELAALLRVVPIRPTASLCLVQSAVQVEFAGGDALYPVHYDWRGLSIDADRRPSAAVGIEDDAAERDFLLASGLEGSVLEHRLFEDDHAIASVSTAKALQLARQAGITVLDLGPADGEAALTGLPLDTGVKREIAEALASGYRARVPAAPVGLQAWTGVGYVLLDPETGESAWQLQGGYSGGITAAAVVELPGALVDVLWRQSETPQPGSGAVAFVQKFATSDYQFGTVDGPLAKPFRVLVTDDQGFPVAGAPVTFSVLGGGGFLVDPATGRGATSEVTVLSCFGTEEQGPCAGHAAGEATATLRLGAHTGEIPRYTCEEPFTCECPAGETCDYDQVGRLTQVGLNLVTARSGRVTLAEPFTALGYPEKTEVPGVPGQFLVNVAWLAPPQLNPVLLTVADRAALRVSDRHGNPISNVWMQARYRPLPQLAPPPPGGSLFRPANATPGHVLRAEDYLRCSAAHPSVVWGACGPGEGEGVATRSSTAGAFFYPIVGDSPWSYYYFDYGTTADPQLTWVGYHTNGMYCPRPSPSACQAWDAPQTFVWQGTRPVTVNAPGNLVEAYPPGASAEVGLWADVVYEEARVERSVDAGGRAHYRALGTNRWRRAHLQDSRFALRPLTIGTGVAGAATHVGEGRYSAPLTMGPTPQLNSVGITGTHLPPLVRYLDYEGGEVDPATVDEATQTLRRLADPTRPIRIEDQFDLWGVRARVSAIDPSPLRLDPGGTVTQGSVVAHEIAPAEYGPLLGPNDVRFEVRAASDGRAVLAALGDSRTRFQIPAGLALPPGSYTGRISLRGVQGDGTDLHSPDYDLPACSLLELRTRQVEIPLTLDPLNGNSCGSSRPIVFSLCRAARVTLTVRGAVLTGVLDGTLQSVENVLLAAGPHAVEVPISLPELVASRSAPFRIEARDEGDPSQAAVDNGVLESILTNRSVLPVGHTFVKGVDLLDGHVVRQATDFKVPGRHLGLELTRTYSNAGSSSEGPLGGGWSLNLASRLYEDESCGLATVVTADGSSQVFHTNDGFVSLTPQKGYHTRLAREDRVAYRFTDKAGNVHRFEKVGDERSFRLASITEPHGDRLAFSYGDAGRLEKVAEMQAGAEVRALNLTYKLVGEVERIVRAESSALGLAVVYEYDARGNLTRASRDGRNVEGAEIAATAARVEEYRYLGPPPLGGAPGLLDPRREHQLVGAVDPNGHLTEYVYYGDGDTLPGEAQGGAGGLLFEEKWELVKQVVEHPEPGLSTRTEFVYDATDAIAHARYTTTVRDARGHDTRYVMNGNGSPLRIEEPLGKTTTMEWATDDIYKTSETDAKGRVTEYAYDARGNLRLERVLTSDLGPVETEYDYDPDFNKLRFKKDAEGRETTYTIDPQTGDLLETRDAVGNLTSYGYDDYGRLQTVTDPRRQLTTHSAHDSFGNARTLTGPLGIVTSRTYDLRGRLVLQTDTLGHETRQTWDGLDRLVRMVRAVGVGSTPPSDDEVTETGYYPGGEVRTVRTPNGAVTTHTIDGLSRVTATETLVDGETLRIATTYDANGNKETETDRRGVTRRFTSDELNRMTAVSIETGLSAEGPAGEIASYTYDLVGNRLSETNLARLTTGFEVDGLYRVRAKLLPERDPATGKPYREEWTYDRVGNLRLLKDANGQATAFEYDGLNRRTKVTNALNQVTTTSYDDPERSHVNRSEEHDLTRGLRTTFTYDALNRETERVVRLEGANGGPTYTTASVYDDASHAVTVTDPRGNVVRKRLDGLDRPFEQTVDPAGLALVSRTAYDGLGNKKSTTDPNGHTTGYRHDGLGRLVEVTDPERKKQWFTYDGEGLKIREIDRRGVARATTYDNVGRKRRESLVEAPISGVAWSHETRYRDRERQRIEIDARGHATTVDLDGLDRAVRETDARGQFREWRWDGVNKREETDKRHARTTFEYDGLNRLRTATDPAPFQSQTVETTYHDAANRVSEKDRRGFVKETHFDPLGRVVSVTRALGTPDEAVVETSTWDGNGNRETQADAEGRTTRFRYDAANRLSSRTDGEGTAEEATTTFVSDGVGNVLEERDPRAVLLGEPWSIKRTWDALDRLETEADGEAGVTTYGYDAEGHRTSVKTPKQKTTAFEYDELGHLLRVIQPPASPGGAVAVTAYAYDPNRNRILQTDARDHSVVLEYDELNRLVRTIQDPRGSSNPSGLHYVTETTRFDANGHPEVVVDPKGQTVTRTWDELNRLKTQAFTPAPGAPVPWRHATAIAYDYDASGNLKHVEETVASGTDPPETPTVLTTDRTWDGLDRLSTETTTLPDGGSRGVSCGYYRNGLRRSITDSAGSVTQYEYDGQNRLQATTTAFGTAAAARTAQTYWPDDLLHTVAYPNGVTATHEYDKADRLLSVRNERAGAAVSSFTYAGLDEGGQPVSYDANGNRLIQIETNGGVTETTRYTYDDLDRLASVAYPPDASHPAARVVTYGYDAVGNRVRETERAAAATILADRQGIFDSINRLTSLTDVSKPEGDPERLTTFTWDPNGNQTSKTVGSGASATSTRYIYDERDKLVEVQQAADLVSPPTSILGRFQYDFDGRRTKKIGEEGLRQYVYDQTSPLTEYDAAGLQKAKYDYGSDRLISLTRSDEGRRYFSLDGLRSVVNLTDDSGSTVASYHLDAWGNFRFPDELTHSANRFAFTGHIFDTETGLYNARARYFDPKLGRFLTQDSYLGQIDEPPSLHRYVYAADRPTVYVDPTGHAFTDAELKRIGTEFNKATAPLQRDARPAYQKGWWQNAWETFYVEATIRAFPGQANMLEGMARQDAKQFASGTGESALAGAVPVVVKEGGGALLDKVPALGRFLRKDLGEFGSSALSKGKQALEAASSRIKSLFGEPPAGGNSLVPATGSTEPLPTLPSGGGTDVAPGLNTGPFEVSSSTGAAEPPVVETSGGLRRTAMDTHALSGSRNIRGQRQSAVTVVRVRLEDGTITHYASGSGGRLSPAQREMLVESGVPKENILWGAKYTKGFGRADNHAEKIILRNLPERATPEEWGISWAERQKPIPCPNCEVPVNQSGGTLQR